MQQFGGPMGYHTEPDSWSEPLNLVKRKTKPVAVVAPSSVIEKNNLEKDSCKPDLTESSNKYFDNIFKNFNENGDISTPVPKSECKNAESSETLETLLTNKNPKYHHPEAENEIVDEKNIIKSENVLVKEEKNVYDEMTSADDPGGGISTTRSGFDPLRPDGLYSMIHSLAACEHKFLTALYMNSLMSAATTTPPGVLSSPVLGFGFPRGSNYFLDYENAAYHTSLAAANPTVNNLLSFADTQNRLWQMVNRQQETQQILDNIHSNNIIETGSPNTVMSPVESERISATTIPEHAASEIVIPKPTFMTSLSSPEGTASKKSKLNTKRSSSMDQKNSTSSTTEGSKTQDSGQTSNNQDKKKPHIKKPLNAFMLYMKEMRAKVVAECTLKESAAINQILGRRWHALGREEQAKYYELARRERQLHMQLYPDWSSRANSSRGKKRKRKQETNDGGNSMKKCRARYGLDQQSQWCKPCRRKKKCIRYMESNESMDGNQSEDNLGSCGSVGDANTPPDDDRESMNHSLSSPGGLSGLSSLTSPSMILPSPSTSLASPSVSLASPCMSLQSPLTPHDASAFECKTPMNGLGGNILPPHQPPSTSSNTGGSGNGGGLPSVHHHHPTHHPPPAGPPLHRNPVGTNPHDINNPLSVNQLTGQCIKTESGGSGKDSSSNSARAVISVT